MVFKYDADDDVHGDDDDEDGDDDVHGDDNDEDGDDDVHGGNEEDSLKKKLATRCLVLVWVHPWGQARIVVFPLGWILLHPIVVVMMILGMLMVITKIMNIIVNIFPSGDGF